MQTITGLLDEEGAQQPATIEPVCEVSYQQLVGVVRQLVGRVAELEARQQESHKFMLTFRQSQLIMLGASEENLHMPRTVTPKHRRNN